ncbi:hypothetical protein VUR80DRAFT_5109 [Thermomyces stellatus]
MMGRRLTRPGPPQFQVRSVNFHPIIGLAVLAALLLQPLWGVLHHARFRALRRRTTWSHLHLWTGRLAIPLGMVNGALGLWRSDASTVVLVSYSVVAAVVWAVWMAFAVVHEMRRGSELIGAGEKGVGTPVGSPAPASRRVLSASSSCSERPVLRRHR